MLIKRRYISPKRKVKTFLLYTKAEGGNFDYIGDFSKKEYLELIKNKCFEIRIGDNLKKIYPAFAMFCKGIEGFDFIIDEMNKQNV